MFTRFKVEMSQEEKELEAVKDVLIGADEDYGPTADTTPAEVVQRIIAERNALKKRIAEFERVHREITSEDAAWIAEDLRKRIEGEVGPNDTTYMKQSVLDVAVGDVSIPVDEFRKIIAWRDELKRQLTEINDQSDQTFTDQLLAPLRDEVSRLRSALEQVADLKQGYVCDPAAAAIERNARLERAVRDAADMDPTWPIEDAVNCVRETVEKNEHLKKQITDLQAACTRLLEERRAVDIRYNVEQFHRAMGVPVGREPRVPAGERVRLCLGHVAEEFFELMRAALKERELTEHAEAHDDCVIGCAESIILTAITNDEISVDLPELADALADLDYVAESTRLEFGIDGRPIARAVHAANMAKLGGPRSEKGKILKPKNWIPPDVAGELRRQGWRSAPDGGK